MKKQLTQQEYLQIQGLFYLGTEANKKYEECERAIETIVGLEENCGSLFGDAIINRDKTLDEVLKIEGITIKK